MEKQGVIREGVTKPETECGCCEPGECKCATEKCATDRVHQLEDDAVKRISDSVADTTL